MRVFVVLLAAFSLFGCARDRQNVDVSAGPIELEPWQNLAIVVRDDDELGRAYRLVAATYVLDSVPIFELEATRAGALTEEGRLYRGYAAPGRHLLQVVLRYEPNDSRILRDRTNMEITSERRFVVLPDAPTTIEAVVNRGHIAFLIDYPEAVASR